MFTGIVSEVGSVRELKAGRLGVESNLAAALEVGGSIAVNGVCLTVTALADGCFYADVVPETQRRSNLGSLRAGSGVNLEAPVRAGAGLDGHFVQGHVDAVTRVMAVQKADLGSELEFELPTGLRHLLAEKGSVTLDGVSLTVAAVDDEGGRFSVAMIPHTLAHTIARDYMLGTAVNVEADVVARYLDRLVRDRGA